MSALHNLAGDSPEREAAPHHSEVERNETECATSSIDPKPDPDKAASFLQQWKPEGPWPLCAFHEDRTGVFGTFGPDSLPELAEWIEQQNKAERNCYWHVNTVKQPKKGKATKSNVQRVEWFHVDVDPKKGKNIREEQERILNKLLTSSVLPTPTVITFSGGGYQAFWKLQQPIEVNCALTQIEDAEQYNVQIAKLLGGDNCHNADRIMRLPGTINWPNAKKRENGQTPVMANVIRSDWDLTYDHTDTAVFVKAPEGKNASVGKNGIAPTVTVDTSNVVRISADALENDPVLSKIESRAKVAIVQGSDPDQPLKTGNSRSDWVWLVACAMVRADVDDDTMYSILTDPDLGISEHIRAQGNATAQHRAALRTIQRAREKVRDPQFVHQGDWRKTATVFIAQRLPHLVHTNADFYTYRGPHYVRVEDATVKADARAFLSDCLIRTNFGTKLKPDWKDIPMMPKRSTVGELMDATRDVAHKPTDTYTPPCWIQRRSGDPNPDDLLAVHNGLLRVSTGDLLEPTPCFFTLNCADVEFDPEAKCPLWLEKMQEVFDGDERIQLLQEIMGYLLAADTSQQKMFLLVGPPRSMKGVLMRMIKRLVGPENYGPMNVNQLDKSTFCLQPLIGRSVGVVADLRLGGGGGCCACFHTAEHLGRR